ncbi:TetR/AcrR family transcriptional regulator [Leuconostoc rapi]|uniref:TetR/AcrR family transcriptional regulator n=1 Tax=Leuconostoc rapi TaxID=1406906 RepID=UPI00195AFE1C|nr:TetR/AcrR family transcriptional regulator [Leuconostoc rapi]
MVGKEDARILRTKKLIEETTIGLLTTQPEFSITTLLGRAQVTRGTFYKYYRNKEHLISEVNNSLLVAFMAQIQGQFHLAKMIAAVSDRAAFYNAVLNLHHDSIYFTTLMSRMRTQMQTQLSVITDDELRRRQIFQWEIVTGGFWALIAKWLVENMNLAQTELLAEFVEILRINTTGWAQTGLALFNFERLDKK